MQPKTCFEQITKRYIIDVLNLMFFEETCTWEGTDQYASLPIIESAGLGDSGIEHRGVLLLHSTLPHAMKVLISRVSTSVSYRIKGIDETRVFIEPPRVTHPQSLLNVDFSISDQNLGAFQPSAMTFANLSTPDFQTSSKMLTNLVSFLTRSIPVLPDSAEEFIDLVHDNLSEPPLSSDKHFIPVYGTSPNPDKSEDNL